MAVIPLATVALVGIILGQTSVERSSIDWLSITVEREAFTETSAGAYGTIGSFDGVALLYLSTSQREVQLKGLRRATMPHLGQQPHQIYEIYYETFAIESLVRVGDREFTFHGVNTGPFPRRITGKVRYSIAASGRVGSVGELELSEHGQAIKGVMNRYVVAKSIQATALLKKHDDVFFGGNYVALTFGR